MTDGDREQEGGDSGDDDREGDDGVVCPHCGSANTRQTSLFGAGEMTMQYYCDDCHSAFDRVKWT